MIGNQRCAQTPFGFFYSNQPSFDEPSYYISLEEARSRKLSNQGWFINCGKDFRAKSEREPDNREKLAGGSVRDSWHIAESDHFLVMQMWPVEA